ncbi:retrovirus-related Pol polyprotein from transposon TNT 1-94 [Trichonephila clavipes]|nr:retrovirus-related Pol polyprotein from transposon TNT 1-94 [Trichonephila clavipes]
MGKTKKLLGIEFEELGNSLFIHQRSCIRRLCEIYEKYKYPVSSLPISKGQVLSKLDSPKTSEEILTVPYRNLIGSLSSIAIRTRPDIMYAVNVLSQFQANPGIKHWNCLLRLLGYLKYTQEYKLELSKVKSLKLRCYSDSDFATNRDDRVSMGGFITFIDETPISWRTFKQKSVSLSTMEADPCVRCVIELVIPSKAKIIDLKKLIESSAVYKNDIEFVRSLVENALEKSKQEAEKNERDAEKNKRDAEKNKRDAEKNKRDVEKNKREAEIQLEKIKLSQIEKQLELEKVRKESEKNPQTLKSGEPSSITDKLKSLVKSIKTLTIHVPVRSESFNLFFHSLEKAIQIKSMPDELKAEILLNIFGERVNNLLKHM